MGFDRLKFAAQLRRQKRRAKSIRGVEYSESLALQYARSQIRIVNFIQSLATDYIKHLVEIGYIHDSLPSFINTVTLAHRESISKMQDASAVSAIGRIDAYHKSEFLRGFKGKVGINLQSVVRAERLETKLADRIKENVNLISKANIEQLDRIEEVIKTSMLSGVEMGALETAIGGIGDVFESRAKLIARDQTSKLVSGLNAERQQSVGITSYIWRTAGDNAVRESHRENDGHRFFWDSPPPETGHPGDDIQCRCVADPDVEGFLESIPDE